MKLTGKVALITGGAGGIGRAAIHAYIQQTPIGRTARPAELANILCCPASDASALGDGHTIVVDGGFVAR